MSTVYTYNNKVLKNTATDKWLAKKEAPAGFVMNASNATITNNLVSWEGPNYPNGYDGEGKTLQIIVKEEGFTCASLGIEYSNSRETYGPGLVNDSNTGMWANPGDTGGMGTASIPVGTYNLTIIHNAATASSGYGKYITFKRNGPDTTIDLTLLSKIEFRIID